MTMDVWIKEALTDDTMVVELLLGLKHSSPDCYAASTPPPVLHPHLKWGQRQQRSTKKAAILRKKNREVGSSPTTPFSWSGSVSPSDGYEESSGHSDRSSGGRSKGTFSNETNTISTRRLRIKKTFSELKEEETSLVEEMTHLKRELASLHVNLKEQRMRSENFKRMKLDLRLQSEIGTSTVPDEPDLRVLNQGNRKEEASGMDCGFSVLSRLNVKDNLASMDDYIVQKDVEDRDRCFVLPDLNMTPTEDFAHYSAYAMG